MSQQKPVVNGKPYKIEGNDIRRLFVQTGFGYVEIANSKGKYFDEVNNEHTVARLVERYSPPSATTKSVEIKVSSGASILHGGGRESYKIGLRLIFPNRVLYNDFMFFLGNEYKFYDEKGSIYQCVISGSPDINRVESGNRYDVSIQLIGIKKSSDDTQELIRYTDLVQDQVYEIEVATPSTSLGYVDLYFLYLDKTFKVLVSRDTSIKEVRNSIYNVLVRQGAGKEYTITAVEDNKIHIVPKRSAYSGAVSVSKNTTGSDIQMNVVQGKHWASHQIENCARLGFVAQYDTNGNYVYTYNPNQFTTRAQFALVLNRLRQYFERVVL